MPSLAKIITITLVLTSTILAEYSSSISPISPEIKKRMIKGNSWREGCPVALKDLRYLHVKHINFSGEDQMGEIIVHKEVSAEVAEIFEVIGNP
jgi:poly-gamma-glutamate synthesis protein (capsule biosynthesis protein)